MKFKATFTINLTKHDEAYYIEHTCELLKDLFELRLIVTPLLDEGKFRITKIATEDYPDNNGEIVVSGLEEFLNKASKHFGTWPLAEVVAREYGYAGWLKADYEITKEENNETN